MGRHRLGRGSGHGDVKRQFDGPEPDRVTVPQPARRGHRLVADKCAIAAAQILDGRLLESHNDGRMTPGDFRQIDPDRRTGIAANDVDAFRQRNVSTLPPDP